MTKLAKLVVLRGLDGQPVVLKPGDDLPDWAAGRIMEVDIVAEGPDADGKVTLKATPAKQARRVKANK